ncbi:hypothetical protein LZ32DRAFT_460517 [Colletotrichum eremochloae]|nr:hypothetical protein LZ32DRAFT_460517 [Colletotrichum eremochloae]
MAFPKVNESEYTCRGRYVISSQRAANSRIHQSRSLLQHPDEKEKKTTDRRRPTASSSPDMSATTPNEPAPGVHAGDSSGIHETPLGGNQHVQLQNTDTHDMAAAHNNGGTGQQEHHHQHHQHPQQKHQKHHKGEISAIVDTVVNKALGFGGASKAEKRKSLGAT